jgi:hypothetical protein
MAKTSVRKDGTLAKHDPKTKKLAGSVQTKGKKAPTIASLAPKVVKATKPKQSVKPLKAIKEEKVKSSSAGVKVSNAKSFVVPVPLTDAELKALGLDLEKLREQAKKINMDDAPAKDENSVSIDGDYLLEEVLDWAYKVKPSFPPTLHRSNDLAMDINGDSVRNIKNLHKTNAARLKLSIADYDKLLEEKVAKSRNQFIVHLISEGIRLKDIAVITWGENEATFWQTEATPKKKLGRKEEEETNEITFSKEQPNLVLHATMYVAGGAKGRGKSSFRQYHTLRGEFLLDDSIVNILDLDPFYDEGWEYYE